MDMATKWLKENDPNYRERRKLEYGYLDKKQLSRAREKEIPASVVAMDRVREKLGLTDERAKAIRDLFN